MKIMSCSSGVVKPLLVLEKSYLISLIHCARSQGEMYLAHTMRVYILPRGNASPSF